MLGNIKSTYFTKIIFSYTEERIKLEIIKYNKSLQNFMDINLINYKIFSGKYIIFESNEKSKEYDSYNNELIYEGEYLKGKRNGHGKEYYYEGKLKFEGEYLKGKRNGYGKEYDYDGNILFEGDYLNGKKWNGKGYSNNVTELNYELKNGKGLMIDYDKSCYLEYEGDYLNGKRNGKGKEYDYRGNLKFEGEYLNGKRSGKGKKYYVSGDLQFEGEYCYGHKWIGKLYGNIISEIKNGKGYINNYFNHFYNFIFDGEYLNGKKNGKGKEYYMDKLKFEGNYINGKRNGKGKEYDNEEKLRFEGIYLYNHKIKGKEFIQEKLEYEGEYLFDRKWNGKGFNEKGDIIYELINGNGKVKEYDNRVNIWTGTDMEKEKNI